MRRLRVITNIVAAIGVPALFWVWYCRMVREASSPLALKSGALALALLVTSFTLFLALVSLARVQTAFVSETNPLRSMLRNVGWFFAFTFALLGLYLLYVYFQLQDIIPLP